MTMTVKLADDLTRETPQHRDVVFDVQQVGVSYDGNLAVRDVSMEIYARQVTAIIGPSGCGKSTFIRVFNHMNDLIPGAKVHGKVLFHGEDLYGADVDPVEVRKQVGMVFQKPNPFPKSGRACSGGRRASTNASSAPCTRLRSGTRSRTG